MKRRDWIVYSTHAAAMLALPACGGGSGPAAASTPIPAPVGTETWALALDDITQTLQTRHIRPWGVVSQNDFLASAQTLRANLGSMTEPARVAAMMQLVARVADGHTTLSAWRWHAFLPLGFTQFSDGVFATGGSPAQARLARARVLSLGGTPIASALPRLSAYWPAENPQAARRWAELLLSSGTVLQHAGLAASTEAASLELELVSGISETVTLATSPDVSQNGPFSTAATPLDRKNPGLPYWFEVLAPTGALYLRYRQCTDGTRFASLATQLFAQLDQGSITRVVVDLRDNEGGDDSVWRPFTEGLRARARPGVAGRLAVITNRLTFSAGVDATLDMLALGALHVGEAPGQSPNFLGNVQALETRLPGMTLRYPTRVSTRVAGNPASLLPALAVERSAADHFAGRDPALEAALAATAT